MKKVTRRQIVGVLNELAADILTGKAKVKTIEVRIDTADVPGEVMMEKHPTGKQWITIEIQRRPPRRKWSNR